MAKAIPGFGFLPFYFIKNLPCSSSSCTINIISQSKISEPSLDPHRVTSWVMQNFVTFDSMYITLKCDHSLLEQYFTMELFNLQFSLVCNFALLAVKGKQF